MLNALETILRDVPDMHRKATEEEDKSERGRERKMLQIDRAGGQNEELRTEM